MNKICSRCKKRQKAISATQNGGVRTYCRECDREWQRTHSKYRRKIFCSCCNERRRNGDSAYCRECHAKRMRERYSSEESHKKYLKRREAHLLRRREHYKENRQKYYEWTKAWREKNPDVIRSLVRNYKSRNRNATGSHTADDIRRLWWFQKGRCQYCGKKLHHGMRGFHVDHMQPLSRDGSNDPANLTLACGRCNDTKHSKTSAEFLALVI